MIKIKHATEAYTDAILEIEAQTFGEETPESLRRAIKSPTFKYYVATIDDKVVGYGAINIMLGEAEVLTIAVETEHRKAGIGGMILGKMIERAKADGVEKVFLEVNSTNDPALRLYKKFGFEEISLRENYYKGKDGKFADAKIMMFKI